MKASDDFVGVARLRDRDLLRERQLTPRQREILDEQCRVVLGGGPLQGGAQVFGRGAIGVARESVPAGRREIPCSLVTGLRRVCPEKVKCQAIGVGQRAFGVADA